MDKKIEIKKIDIETLETELNLTKKELTQVSNLLKSIMETNKKKEKEEKLTVLEIDEIYRQEVNSDLKTLLACLQRVNRLSSSMMLSVSNIFHTPQLINSDELKNIFSQALSVISNNLNKVDEYSKSIFKKRKIEKL